MGLRDDILAFRPYNEQEETEKRLMLQYMDTFPDLLTRENEMAHFTASCWIVNPARTHALMAFHNLYQSWAWLGGHADGEEDLLRVALREANEESGIVGARPLRNDIFSLEILGVDGHVKRGRYVATHLHLNCTYLLEADDRLPIRVKADENSGVKWVGLDEAVALSSEPWIRERIYRKLIEKTRELAPRFATR